MLKKLRDMYDSAKDWSKNAKDPLYKKFNDKKAASEFKYTGHKWNIDVLEVSKTGDFITIVDDMFPVRVIDSLDAEKAKEILNRYSGWNITDLKNKMVKTAYGASTERFLSEIRKKVKGDPIEITGFSVINPNKMVDFVSGSNNLIKL